MQVWKFPLGGDGISRVVMPVGARVLSAQMQGGNLQLWALVDENQPHGSEVRTFAVIGTGWVIEQCLDGLKLGNFISTFQCEPRLVFHVFELEKP